MPILVPMTDEDDDVDGDMLVVGILPIPLSAFKSSLNAPSMVNSSSLTGPFSHNGLPGDWKSPFFSFLTAKSPANHRHFLIIFVSESFPQIVQIMLFVNAIGPAFREFVDRHFDGQVLFFTKVSRDQESSPVETFQ